MGAKMQKETEAKLTEKAMREMEKYCAEHPRSPAALRRPRLMHRGSSWIALIGSTLQDGIAGIGSTVGGALRAFDVQYANSLRPRG